MVTLATSSAKIIKAQLDKAGIATGDTVGTVAMTEPVAKPARF
jgi:hypothetical protein